MEDMTGSNVLSEALDIDDDQSTVISKPASRYP